MQLFTGYSSCRYFGPLLLAILVLSTGCQTSKKPLFTVSGPGWCVQEGQALWRPRTQMPELGGDLVVASHEDGRCVIQFSKTPLPLVMAQTSRTNWFIQFPPQKMSFAGSGAPPARFVWLHLSAAFSGKPLPAHLAFQRKPERAWRLENSRSGETLEGFLAP